MRVEILRKGISTFPSDQVHAGFICAALHIGALCSSPPPSSSIATHKSLAKAFPSVILHFVPPHVVVSLRYLFYITKSSLCITYSPSIMEIFMSANS